MELKQNWNSCDWTKTWNCLAIVIAEYTKLFEGWNNSKKLCLILSGNKYKLALRFHIKFIIALISATKICCQKKNSFFSNLKGKLNKYILLNISYPNIIIIINENLVIFSHVIKNAIMKV